VKITNEVRERINQLAAKNDGHITPEIVLEDARDPTSPLHDCYNWDINQAAHEHWIETSRRLIRGVRVVIKEEKVIIRAPAYVRDPEVASDAQGYVSVAKLRNSEDLSREALVYEFTRAAAALRRAREIAAALSLREYMDVMLEQIELWTSQLQRRELDRPKSALHG
jgi:hypothetical protein